MTKIILGESLGSCLGCTGMENKRRRSSFGQVEFVLLEECDQGEENEQASQHMSLGFKGSQSQRCRFSH